MIVKYDFKHRSSAEYRFFLFDPEGDGIIFFRTEEERDAYAKVSIKEYCPHCGEGWSEDVESVCSGVFTHIITKTDVISRPLPKRLTKRETTQKGTGGMRTGRKCAIMN